MQILILQLLGALMTAAFAVAAGAVARARAPLPEVHRTAWILVSAAFAWKGLAGVLQASAAVWAFRAGQGSRAWDLLVAWGPAANQARMLVAVGMACALVLLPRLRPRSVPRLWWSAGAGGAVLLVLGAFAGWMEGEMNSSHLTTTAVLLSLELVVVLAALLVGLFLYTLDRYLWIALAAYAFHLALGVLWISAMTGYFVPGGWYPDLRYMYAYALAVHLGMVAAAARRLALARRRVPVSALLEPADPRGFSTL